MSDDEQPGGIVECKITFEDEEGLGWDVIEWHMSLATARRIYRANPFFVKAELVPEGEQWSAAGI